MKEIRDYFVSLRLTKKESDCLSIIANKRHTTKTNILRELLYLVFEKEGFIDESTNCLL